MPTGLIRIVWNDRRDQVPRIVEVHQWLRLDWIFEPGERFTVQVEGREFPDFDYPPRQNVRECEMTNLLADQATVIVGEPDRDDGWFFGLLLTGVSPVPPRSRD